MAYGKQTTRGLRGAALAVAMAAILAAPSAADRVVTTDGSVFATRGAWKVQGEMVVFSTPEGVLMSLKLEDVDLEASREATAAAARAKAPPREEAPPATQREPVLVLTDKDVNHVRPRAPRVQSPAPGSPEAPAATDPAAPTRGASPAKPTGAGGRLVVRQWREQRHPSGDGIVFTGEVANTSADVVANIQLSVVLKDREGGILESKTARITSSILEPEKFLSFRVDFPGLYVYDDVEFRFDGFALQAGPQRPAGIGTTDDQ